jgi:hypothetical protein
MRCYLPFGADDRGMPLVSADSSSTIVSRNIFVADDKAS